MLSVVVAVVALLGFSAAAAAAAGQPAQAIDGEALTSIFSKDELDQCTRFRTPNLVRNPHTGHVHVIVRCCGKNRCSGKNTALETPQRRVNMPGDDIKDCKVAMKSSKDGGKKWHNFQILSPAHGVTTGFGNGAGIYDSVRKRMVVQYQYIPGGSTAPTVNTTYFQMFSDDDGNSWSSPTDITQQLRGCNPDTGNMMTQSAGDKTQTGSGRLVWAGHDHKGHVCLWYSDNGGSSYNVTKLLEGNEVSVAVATSSHLLMNGRGQQFTFFPHRADYWSTDNAASWSSPEKSPLLDDDDSGCERSLVNINGTLYSSEPQDKKRTKMVVACSKDGGKSWKHTINVDGDNSAAYSDITEFNGMLVLVFESDEGGTDGNILSTQLHTDWCK